MKLQQRLTAATAGLLLAMVPFSAVAEPPAHAKAGKKHHQEVVQTRHRDTIRQASVSHCPPGLARKNPPCIPPGQAQKHGISVGDVIVWDDIHVITRPGLYGLSIPPDGDRYAIVDGRLVRVDEGTGKILSILRLVSAILD